jgi:hypothetical protein
LNWHICSFYEYLSATHRRYRIAGGNPGQVPGRQIEEEVSPEKIDPDEDLFFAIIVDHFAGKAQEGALFDDQHIARLKVVVRHFYVGIMEHNQFYVVDYHLADGGYFFSGPEVIQDAFRLHAPVMIFFVKQFDKQVRGEQGRLNEFLSVAPGPEGLYHGQQDFYFGFAQQVPDLFFVAWFCIYDKPTRLKLVHRQ